MSQLNIEDSLILIIDIQEKLLNAVFSREALEKKAAIIANAAGILNIPVVVTEQYPQGLGSTITSLKSVLKQNTRYFEKSAFSALDEPEIRESVKNFNKNHIIIFGIETHICVNQTTSALLKQGYEVSVIKDACASRVESEHMSGLERMNANGASVLTVETALFEWLKTSKHPNFKEIQYLIK